jgi:hypothetical protein
VVRRCQLEIGGWLAERIDQQDVPPHWGPDPYVAAQAGHSPEECARTYLHLFEEHQDLEPGERVSAEEAIRAARVRTAYGNNAERRGA